MVRVDDALVRQMIATIVEVADPEREIHSGSRRRGEADVAAAVDPVVVEAEPDSGAEWARLRRAPANFHVPKDVLVNGIDEVSRRRGSPNHVPARALREGRVFYPRP
ncbi:MAG: nucleotidyltransferase domain-containing protein [Boseongicola sp. SB0673_bin_14]|nr:nucleotidyltransferase domain-containing protein [Boseongicola sp. SB0667_bin_21]MYI67269.1 nucleotidyltransferase domain-containing protein [Boseongicola sp. SB0673_bin_14]